MKTTLSTDPWRDVCEERSALLELLETLGADAWDHPTLCSRWRVRDVVAHLIHTTEVRLPSAIPGIVRAGFDMNRYIDREARRRGSAPASKLLEEYRTALPRTTHPPGQSNVAMLEDIVIHQMDIRLPLGRRRPVGLERMKVVADYLDGNGFYPGKALARGLRLEATDTDWSTGQGPLVRGPVEALALTLSGRYVDLDQLGGDGVVTLRSRIPA
jgi:uncharacterized protein (TIGR03083 family)